MVEFLEDAVAPALAPFRLRRDLGDRFMLLHLVRDPRGVSWSAVKKAGRQGTRPLVALRSSAAALGWGIANAACEIFGRRYPGQYIRLRYEDLAAGSGRRDAGSVRGSCCRVATWDPEFDRFRCEPPSALRQSLARAGAEARRHQGGCGLAERHARRQPRLGAGASPRRFAPATATAERNARPHRCVFHPGRKPSERGRKCQPNQQHSKRPQARRSPPSAARSSPSELKGASRSMYKSMTEQELDEMASTKRKGKPEHVSESHASSPTTAAARARCRRRRPDVGDGEPHEHAAAAPSASVTEATKQARGRTCAAGSRRAACRSCITVSGGVPPAILSGKRVRRLSGRR